LSEEKKEKERPRYLITEAKHSPPPEPVNNLLFQSTMKKGLTSPPPEPEGIPPFSRTRVIQSKETKENKKTEG
jgi:hypothetical protein